jgi:hypothetical protein
MKCERCGRDLERNHEFESGLCWVCQIKEVDEIMDREERRGYDKPASFLFDDP